MRKIEQQMNAAILQGKTWCSGNTSVVFTERGQGVITLHNHIIALIRDGEVVPSRPVFRHWPTATTRSRLRALGVDACIRNGVAYIDGEPA